MLERMAHRGACACDNNSGDGAGVMAAIPDQLYRDSLNKDADIDLPPYGEYATGIIFMKKSSYKQAKTSFADLANFCGLKLVAWRKLGSKPEILGAEARKTEPCIRQVFVTSETAATNKEQFERTVYLLRKAAVHHFNKEGIQCYVCSLSTSTIVYKVRVLSLCISQV